MAMLKNITIDLGLEDNPTVVVTIEEARKLYDELHEMFGAHPYHIPMIPYTTQWYETTTGPRWETTSTGATIKLVT